MQLKITRDRLKSIWKILLILIVIAVIVVAAYEISRSQNFYKTQGQDFFAIWLAPRLLIEGKNPYNPSDWVSAYAENQAHWVKDASYLYPLPLAVLLLPIGLVPIEYGATIWIAFGIICILLTVYLILGVRGHNLPVSYIIPIIAGVFLFRSTAETLRLGQLDWLMLLVLTLGLLSWEKEKWLIGGVILGFTVLKPQLGIPLLVFFSVWLAMRRKWPALFGEVVTLFGLYAIGWLFNHRWLVEWVTSGQGKVYENMCCTPTLWGLASGICGFNLRCGLILGGVFTVFACGLAVYLFIRMPIFHVKYAFGMIIPLSLLISPYLWTYSQIILLIPILTIVSVLVSNKISYLIIAAFPLCIALFSSAIVFISMNIGVDIISAAVPLVILGCLLFIYQKFSVGEKTIEEASLS